MGGGESLPFKLTGLSCVLYQAHDLPSWSIHPGVLPRQTSLCVHSHIFLQSASAFNDASSDSPEACPASKSRQVLGKGQGSQTPPSPPDSVASFAKLQNPLSQGVPALHAVPPGQSFVLSEHT